jgi:hypothetical protein
MGLQGLKGDKGDTGNTGLKGDKGDPGQGFHTRGNWIAGMTLLENEYVYDRSTNDPLITAMWLYKGTVAYVSNTQPYLDTANFTEFAGIKGDKGDTGEQGIQGIQGIQGPPGATTADGVTIADTAGNFTAANVEDALAEVFQSGVNCKNSWETSINAKGGTVSKAGSVATVSELQAGMDTIETGADTTDATATEANILQGLTAYTALGKVTGTMKNNGAVTITPSSAEQAIPTGYHEGGKVSAVSFDASKVLNDTTIAGTQGTMSKKSGVVITPSTTEQAVPQGYYDGTTASGKVGINSGKQFTSGSGNCTGTAGQSNSKTVALPFAPSKVIVSIYLSNGTNHRTMLHVISNTAEIKNPSTMNGETSSVIAQYISASASASFTNNNAGAYISGTTFTFGYWLDAGYTGTYKYWAFE